MGTYRDQIDKIDEQIVKLFNERMDVVKKIGEFKKENNLPVLDAKRENEKMVSILEMSNENIKEYTYLLYSLMLELSRGYQHSIIGADSEIAKNIKKAIDETPNIFPEFASVACQGIEGANSHTACTKLFRQPNTMFFNNFDSVFTAIEKGLCKYGVIPVENSTAGTVNKVYDLMMHHNFYIVKSIRLKVEHNLLVKKGVKLEDIKEIYSHEQAINQCSKFLSSLSGVKIIPCENTAIAARMVSESDRNDIAAISSKICTKYYGLDCLCECIQDNDNNYTRFICISKNLEIYPGANRTSLMATLSHEPGALYKLLSRLYALGINLNKLESRPLQNKEFEFMFYFDLDTEVYSPRFIQLIGELPSVCENFSYLGSYSEVL